MTAIEFLKRCAQCNVGETITGGVITRVLTQKDIDDVTHLISLIENTPNDKVKDAYNVASPNVRWWIEFIWYLESSKD